MSRPPNGPRPIVESWQFPFSAAFYGKKKRSVSVLCPARFPYSDSFQPWAEKCDSFRTFSHRLPRCRNLSSANKRAADVITQCPSGAIQAVAIAVVAIIVSPDSKHERCRRAPPGTRTCIHQNIVQHSKFEKTDLPTTELGSTH